ncbi:MAG TPA: peptidylprolyl isomerase [Candidatus Aminicenantes bacterium]|nr:peptidylprolyl isomerase [Candidatus Aminicenantes bacterium]
MEWRASHILVKDRNLAERIRREIQAGAPFADMARRYSTCPSKSKGGDLGWFGPGKMVVEFERAVQKLANSGISPVVQTRFGYHVIRKTGQRD